MDPCVPQFRSLTGWAMVSASRSGMATNYFGLLQWPNLPFFSGLPRPEKMSLHRNSNTSHLVLALTARAHSDPDFRGVLSSRDSVQRVLPHCAVGQDSRIEVNLREAPACRGIYFNMCCACP